MFLNVTDAAMGDAVAHTSTAAADRSPGIRLAIYRVRKGSDCLTEWSWLRRVLGVLRTGSSLSK